MQSILVRAMVSQDWLFLDMLVYWNRFIHCIRIIIVLGLLLYLRFCHGLTKGEIVRVMYFGIVNQAKLRVFYWVLIYFKVVIEDQVKDTKFVQEKLKNTFSACTSIVAQ